MHRFLAYITVILKIFARDVKRIICNPIAVIVLAGVCLLPSLYAWYIVAANWDPYENTANLKVAIVNEDKGADDALTGSINIGDQVVEALRDNHQMGWQFEDEAEAMQNVEAGNYFGAIVIPEDFSQSFLSIFSSDYKQPQIDYYINEKLSGSGTKIVDAGAQAVQESIDQQFIKMVSSKALETSVNLGEEVNSNEQNAEQQLVQNLQAINESLGITKVRVNELRNTVNSIQTPSLNATGELQQSVSNYISTVKSEVRDVANVSDSLISTTQDNLTEAVNSTEALQSSLNRLHLDKLLGMNIEEVSSFMSQPVDLKTEKIYPVANYGSGVTPFFTNLALWVSSLFVLALMKIRVDKDGVPDFTDTQAYFARWLLLIVISIVQSTIVCVGDLVLGIQCLSPAAFIGAGILSGVVYANLMFALVYSMRHVGRALSIILLIIQIPGSSGMFPIQMMPEFFQILNPLLPFTYSIDAMREAIGGFYGFIYLKNMLVLALVFLPVGFLIGLLVGRYSYNLNVMFDEKLAEGGLYATESILGDSRQFRLHKMLRPLMQIPEYRNKVRENYERFQAVYPKLNKAGWIAIFALPLVIFALLVIFRGGVNTVLLLLTLFVVGILILISYLITISYLDINGRSQLKLLDDPDAEKPQVAGSLASAAEAAGAGTTGSTSNLSNNSLSGGTELRGVRKK